MKISKSIWIFAMSLIALLPGVFAQGAGQSFSWLYVAGNAAIIAGVLFVLQAFLIQGKDPKEMTVVPLIIIIASLVIAWQYGRFGWIWQTGPLANILNIKVIGNALIIGAVLYFILGLTVGEKLKSTSAQVGLGILTFVIAVFFAMKVGNAWIWEQATVRQFMGYLFGPQGILNPNYGLWIFITSFVLILFFFNNYLFKEGVGKGATAINYMLALLLASNLASSGISMNTVIKLGEIIFVMIFQQALSKNFDEKRKWLAWIVAIILVGWASYAMTAGTQYQGIMGWVIGDAVPAGLWTGWKIIQIMILIGAFFGIYYFTGKMSERFGHLEGHEESHGHDAEEGEGSDEGDDEAGDGDSDEEDENPENDEGTR